MPRPLPNQKVKIRVLEDLAEHWNSNDVRYAVTNGLQGYPKSIGRDIDVLFHEKDLERALKLTVQFLGAQGFTVLPFHLAWVYWVVGIRRNENGSVDSVQIDLFDHLQWAFTWVIDSSDTEKGSARSGPFKTDAWASVGKRLILNALARNYGTFRNKPHYLDLTIDEKEVLEENLERLAGVRFEGLEAAILERNLEKLEEEIPLYRKTVMKKALTSSKRLIPRMHSAWLKQWCVNIWPRRTTPIISIVGSDIGRVRELVSGVQDYIQSHLVFTCSKQYDIPDTLFGERPHKIWWDMLKNSLRRDSKTSALQVIQFYIAHPVGDPHDTLIPGESIFLKLLPSPDIVIDLDVFGEFKRSWEFHDLVLEKLLIWFEANGELAAKEIPK